MTAAVNPHSSCYNCGCFNCRGNRFCNKFQCAAKPQNLCIKLKQAQFLFVLVVSENFRHSQNAAHNPVTRRRPRVTFAGSKVTEQVSVPRWARRQASRRGTVWQRWPTNRLIISIDVICWTADGPSTRMVILLADFVAHGLTHIINASKMNKEARTILKITKPKLHLALYWNWNHIY